GLLRPPATVVTGRVVVAGRDVAALSPAALRRLQGDRVALVPQQAMNALNPVFAIGDQLAEAVTLHRPVTRRQARRTAGELLGVVGIDPDRLDSFPHQLSGGMRQRVVIAMALANDPALLIADEPTTGLDVLVQGEILALLGGLQRRLGLAMLVVSHDLPVVLRLADRLAVMRDGRIVEEGPASQLAASPRHPYTQGLLDATPRLRAPTAGVPVAAAP
ncbi:MAG: ABC transporter ATP-binding protein, partial [Actinomycetota bacterium]|nr:ABC transporter ATP-binding protein [Actinomycetota bacterium]